ncbi:hypothetical protein IPF37_01275 [bacterium]|nr:MAG: hypothetical protein IPF37_01275 [bacterium]
MTKKMFLIFLMLISSAKHHTIDALTESKKLLKPFTDLEIQLDTIALNAGIKDWNERISRFKHNLAVLTTDPTLQKDLLTEDIKTAGLSGQINNLHAYPDESACLILSILGLKPINSDLQNNPLLPRIKDLIDKKKLLDMNCDITNGMIGSKPTIPFFIIFKNYEVDFDTAIKETPSWNPLQESIQQAIKEAWEKRQWIYHTHNIKTAFLDIEKAPEEQGETLQNFAKNKLNGASGFGGNNGWQEVSAAAVVLGWQPCIRSVTTARFNDFFKYFPVVLTINPTIEPDQQATWERSCANPTGIFGSITGFIGSDIRNESENSSYLPNSTIIGYLNTKKYKELVPPDRSFSNHIYVDLEHLASFTFIGNMHNYRHFFCGASILYNDNSTYMQLKGLLLEYFFRSSFGDDCFLALLYQNLTQEIEKATTFCLKPREIIKAQIMDMSFTKINLIFNVSAISSDTKEDIENRIKQKFGDNVFETIFPDYHKETIVDYFKQFLSTTFGQDTWQWNSDNQDNPLTFNPNKKDKMLTQFLKTIEKNTNTSTTNLTDLQTALTALKACLVKLCTSLHNLQNIA